ncbi:MAG TPA: hypothetical protein VGO83_12330 [Thermoleophilaceae bacterium]|jgi:hypothetical protein|nr:hypothetical protein [Thermoleophilaceae bacterium]
MLELQLTRSKEDKRRLDLAGVGSVRFENLWGTKLRLTAPGQGEWRVVRSRRGVAVSDAAGTTVAAFVGDGVESGDVAVEITTPHQGLLGRRPSFLLLHGERELARVDPSVWSEKPLAITVLDEDFVARHPLLFLLALYRAQLVAASRQAAAAAGVVT